jgi:L-2-hydroxyglutarate oxidase LhgO
MRFDSLVVGAGVVGLAVARRLARAGQSVLVVERHERAIQETSSRNSQVLHAGLYYPRESLKARLCVRGNASLAAYCEAKGVPFARTGKLIVATEAAEEPELDRLLAQGRANGVPGLSRIDGARVAALEPQVRAVSALMSASTGALDVHGLAAALEAEAKDAGATFAWRHRVRAGAREGDAYRLELEVPEGGTLPVHAARVVNAAGLDADVTAAALGLDVDAAGYRLHWAKGRYARVRLRGPVRHHVYPVPAKHLAGLGVHLTVGLDGDARLGPDVQFLSERRQDYAVDESILPAFHQAARRYLPALELSQLSVDQAGIRPKLSGPGEPFRDFVVAEESARGLPGVVSLIGIESPGLTCCLELAEEVARLLG